MGRLPNFFQQKPSPKIEEGLPITLDKRKSSGYNVVEGVRGLQTSCLSARNQKTRL